MRIIETYKFVLRTLFKMYKLVTMKFVRLIIVTIIFGSCFFMASCTKEKQEDNCIIVQNVFTPNANGLNDVLEVTSDCDDTKVVALKIFTRAGVLVFSLEAERCRWDGYSLSGQPLANGIYYYTAEIIDSSPLISKNGFVYLYR